MNADGFIFDVDGTLVDTNRYHVQAWKAAFVGTGHEVAEDDIALHIGKGGIMLIEDILGKNNAAKVGEELDARVEQEFLRIVEKVSIVFFPHALDLLQDIRSLKKGITVVTSSSREEFEAVERKTNVYLLDYVDVVITADDVNGSKPAPDGVLLGVQKMGLPSSACVVVGDSIYDGIAARVAGGSFIGIETGYWGERELFEVGAKRVYRNLAGLREDLSKIGNV